MNERYIVSKINEYLHSATKELCVWLEKMLPRVTEDWWNECVMSNLSYAQQELARENGYDKLEQFDLAALLRIANKSWYDMRTFAYLPTSERDCVRSMMKVRNNWAHCAGTLPDKDVVLQDLNVILDFFEKRFTHSSHPPPATVCRDAEASRPARRGKGCRRNRGAFPRWWAWQPLSFRSD